jgi:predicted nuclease with TOPRIM domain
MDDLDNILNSLGPGAQKAAAKPEDEKVNDSASSDFLTDVPDIPDLDALPATSKSSASAFSPKTRDKQEPASLQDDVLDELLAEADGGDVPSMKSSAVLPPLEPDLDLLAELGFAESQKETPGLAAAGVDISATFPYEKGPAPLPDSSPAETGPLSLGANGAPSRKSEEINAGMTASDAALSGEEPTDSSRTGSLREEVDLNELDALLDNMLATAPASGPALLSTPSAAPLAAPPAPESPEKKESLDATGVADDMALVRQEILELRGELEHGLEIVRKEISLAAKPEESMTQELENQSAALAAQEARLEDLELNQTAKVREYDARFAGQESALSAQSFRMTNLEETLRIQAGSQTEDVAAVLADHSARLDELGAALAVGTAKIEDLDTTLADQAGKALEDTLRITDHNGRLQDMAGELADLSEKLVALGDRMASVEQRFADMQENLEKLAAESAAKVIREELAALMKEAG